MLLLYDNVSKCGWRATGAHSTGTAQSGV